MKKLNWDRVIGIIQVPLIFAVCYTASEIGCIGAILFGIEKPMGLIKAGWTIGLLCGATVMYFVTVRPKNKLLKQYDDIIDDLQAEAKEFDDHNRRKRIEGDEWKDAD